MDNMRQRGFKWDSNMPSLRHNRYKLLTLNQKPFIATLILPEIGFGLEKLPIINVFKNQNSLKCSNFPKISKISKP